MQRPKITIASVFILVLGGCGSFNNSFNTYTAPLPKSDKSVPIVVQDDSAEVQPATIPPVTSASQQVVVEVKGQPCGTSPYPPMGQVPELPTKALLEAKGDVYLIERIERKHIDDLRAYISERRRIMREAQERLIAKCEIVSR